MKAAYLVPAVAAVVAFASATPVLLEERADMTYAQNWCVASGTFLTGIGAVGAAIAALIAATSRANTCAHKSERIEPKPSNSRRSLDMMGLHESFSIHGFNVDYEHWSLDGDGSTMMYPLGIDFNGESRLDNLTISHDGSTHARISTSASVNSTDALERRKVDWAHNKVDVYFHASRQCHTGKTKHDIEKAVVKALFRMSNNQHQAACYAMSAGGNWLGHLKVLQLTKGDAVGNGAYNRACVGFMNVEGFC